MSKFLKADSLMMEKIIRGIIANLPSETTTFNVDLPIKWREAFIIRDIVARNRHHFEDHSEVSSWKMDMLDIMMKIENSIPTFPDPDIVPEDVAFEFTIDNRYANLLRYAIDEKERMRGSNG